MKPFQETNYIAKDKENEQWKSSLPPEEVKEKMLAQRGFTQENGSKIQFDHTVFIQYAMTRVHALYCNGKLYFYNFKSKCYEYLEDHAYKKIFFAIIEEASCNIWKRKQENEYIPYFKRKVPYAEDNGMRPGLLQFQNCIFDLQEETIEKPTPDIFCLVQIPYDYDPKAKAPQFFRFLQELFDNDQTRIDLVQEIMGACLYYEDIMQKLVVFLGSGSNGKSLLSNMIKHMLGERNVSAVALDQISSGRFGKQNLDRKLLNISSETKTEKLYSTADLKALTGGDSIEIEEKFEKSYTTEIHSKFILLANDMIQTKDYSDGFYRRLLIIPFEQCFHDLAPNQEPEEGVLYKNIYLEGDLMQELGHLQFCLCRTGTADRQRLQFHLFSCLRNYIGALQKRTQCGKGVLQSLHRPIRTQAQKSRANRCGICRIFKLLPGESIPLQHFQHSIPPNVSKHSDRRRHRSTHGTP